MRVVPPPIGDDWTEEGWHYVDGRVWTTEQLDADQRRANHQFCVEVERQQEVVVASGQLTIRIRKIKVQVTRARRRALRCVVGVVGVVVTEFHDRLVEVLVAGYVVCLHVLCFPVERG